MDSEYNDYGRGDSWRWRRFENNSPLQVVWSNFDRMTRQPLPADPVSVPGVLAESWGQLREQLLDPALSIRTVDAVWAWLIERARQRWHERGGEAVLACVGLAVPMLVELAGRFTTSHSSEDHTEVESELLAGFVHQVRHIDLDRPHLWPRLRSAMLHVGRAWIRRHSTAPRAMDLDDEAAYQLVRPVRIPPDHPDLVLAHAVAEGVLTAEAAALIIATRCESRSLTSAAEEHYDDRSHWTVRKQRQRAEDKLVPWLATRVADPDPIPAPVKPPRTGNTPPRGTTRPVTTPGSSRRSRQPDAVPQRRGEEVRRCA